MSSYYEFRVGDVVVHQYRAKQLHKRGWPVQFRIVTETRTPWVAYVKPPGRHDLDDGTTIVRGEN